MTKHIMLMFLSDIKTIFDKDTQTVSISKADYIDLHDGFGKTESTNESAIRYLLQEGWQNQQITAIDRLFVFASKVVRTQYVGNPKNKVLYKDENNQSYTHLAFFKHRLQSSGILPAVDECLSEHTIYPYDEDVPVNRSMEMVINMAGMIQEYIASIPDSEVVLHVDLSGGMRHVSMMMLELMRLMEYNQVQIGKVLYSNYNPRNKEGKVEEATNVYQFFNLISGAEEFVRYGSVSALLDYYRIHPELDKSSALEKLLRAMEQFAEEIKLCHRGNFERSIQELKAAIHDFKAENIDLSGNRLMKQMMKRIETEYGILFNPDGTALDSIRWCLHHDYLQQAITLYTETVPDYLFKKGVVELTPEGMQEVKEKCKDDKRDIVFYALNVYTVEGSDGQANKKLNKYKKKFKASLDSVLQRLIKGKCTKEEAWAELVDFIRQEPCLAFLNEDQVKNSLNYTDDLLHDPTLAWNSHSSWCHAVVEEYKKDKNAISEDKISSLNEGELSKLLLSYLRGNMTQQSSYKLFGTIQFGYSYRTCELVNAGKLIVNIPVQQFCRIMDRYGTLKDERNLSNHAKIQSSLFTVATLKQYMDEGIGELEALSKA